MAKKHSTSSELSALSRAAHAGALQGVRDLAIVSLLQHTNLSYAEVAKLTRSMVDDSNGWLRDCDIPDGAAAAALRAWLLLRGDEEGPLFVHVSGPGRVALQGLSRQGVGKILDALRVKAGLKRASARPDPSPMAATCEPNAAAKGPAEAYLSRLTTSSRAYFEPALHRLARMVSHGDGDAHSLDWVALSEARLRWLRDQVAQSYAPSTARNYLTAVGGVLRTAVLLQLIDEPRLEKSLVALGLPLRSRGRPRRPRLADPRGSAAENYLAQVDATVRDRTAASLNRMARMLSDDEQDADELGWASVSLGSLRWLRERLHQTDPESAKDDVAALAGTLRVLVLLGEISEEDLDRRFAALALPRRRRMMDRHLSDVELDALYAVCARAGGPYALRDAALIAVTLEVGVGYVESALLDVRDFDIAESVLSVRDSELRLKLPERAHRALRAWLDHQGTTAGPLFLWQPAPHRSPRRIKPETIEQAVARRLREV